MLRRRILASTMASVMALTSVAVVANADETIAQSKTKADLDALVKSYESFLNDDINDYGSISGENFLNAIEYANNVLESDKSTVDDYTVAYSMVEATRAKMVIYSAADLKALLDASKSIYETDNIYNEDLGDLRYTSASWGDFEDAYEDADSVVSSSDSRIITDAYETLEDAKANLAALTTVSKSQFRTTLKAYEAALQKEFAYDSWRVGTITGWADIREMLNDANGDAAFSGPWAFYGQSVSYGTLYEWASYFNETINEGYKKLDGIKSVNKTSDSDIVKAYNIAQDIVDVFNSFTADDTTRGSKATVTKLISEYQGRLVYDYATTAAEELYDMVIEAVGAENIHNRLGDDYSSSIDKDEDAVTSAADAWWVQKALWHDDDDDAKDVYKLVDAQLSIKTDVTFYLIYDNDTDKNVVEVTTTKPSSSTASKTVNKNTEIDLTDYINVKAADIVADSSAVDNHNQNGINDGDFWGSDPEIWSGFQNWSNAYSYSMDINGFGGDYTNSSGDSVSSYANLQTAMQLAEIYVGGDKDEIAASSIYDIDTTDSITDGSAKGSSAEWTLVYRYLKYALSDKYDVATGTYTKADVEELINQAYELAEDTGDAAIFTVNHKALVDARQDALTWIKAANKDKTYKDNTLTYSISDSNGKISGYKVADQVYNELKVYYDELQADLDAFKYSFDDVYYKIADVKASIDAGELEGTATLNAALEETAYRLSVVEAITIDADGNNIDIDNDAFTTDRYFQGYNRVYTGDAYSLDVTDGSSVTTIGLPAAKANGEVTSHALLAEAYENLLAEVEKQTATATLVGDVNGDGLVNSLDASAILKAVVDGTTIETAVGDYNADGAVNALDASAILKAVIAG